MKKRIWLSYALIFVAVIAAGCREQRPAGFPKLYSCVIVITQDGVPAVGIKVSLVGELTARWAVGAITDDQGTASIRTHGYAGAPCGLYKIVLAKTETEGRGQIGDGYSNQGWEDMKIWSLIDPEYENAEETPLEIDIKGAVRQTFEIGKSERRLVEVIKQGMP